MPFEALTPLGFAVRTTAAYWALLQRKHPEVSRRLDQVRQCLVSPVEVRRSKQSSAVYLFYIPTEAYHLCVVVKRLDGDGFVVTCYITDAIKEGTRVWPISE